MGNLNILALTAKEILNPTGQKREIRRGDDNVLIGHFYTGTVFDTSYQVAFMSNEENINYTYIKGTKDRAMPIQIAKSINKNDHLTVVQIAKPDYSAYYESHIDRRYGNEEYLRYNEEYLHYKCNKIGVYRDERADDGSLYKTMQAEEDELMKDACNPVMGDYCRNYSAVDVAAAYKQVLDGAQAFLSNKATKATRPSIKDQLNTWNSLETKGNGD